MSASPTKQSAQGNQACILFSAMSWMPTTVSGMVQMNQCVNVRPQPGVTEHTHSPNPWKSKQGALQFKVIVRFYLNHKQGEP